MFIFVIYANYYTQNRNWIHSPALSFKFYNPARKTGSHHEFIFDEIEALKWTSHERSIPNI